MNVATFTSSVQVSALPPAEKRPAKSEKKLMNIVQFFL
jgi:hypothetical protein